MSRIDPRQEMLQRTRAALELFGEHPREDDSQVRLPDLGELYVFPEAGDTPELWAVVDRDAEDSTRWFVVPADLHPMVGSADVAVGPEDPCGALSLRCRSGAWLRGEDFDSRQRAGRLTDEVVARVRDKRAELADGEPKGSAAQRDTDSEPEYRFLEQALDVAVDRLPGQRGLTAPRGPAPVSASPPLARGRRRARWVPALAVAASVLLALTAGWWMGRSSQKGEIQRLARELDASEAAQLRQQTEHSAETARQSGESRQRLTELRRATEEKENRLQRQIDELRRSLEAATPKMPLVGEPFEWLSPRRLVRDGTSPPPSLTIPRDSSYLALFLEVDGTQSNIEYQLRILRQNPAAVVWQGQVTKTGTAEIFLLLPRELFPAGDYIFELSRRPETATPETAYALRIDSR